MAKWPILKPNHHHLFRLRRRAIMAAKYSAHDAFLKAQLASLPALETVTRLSPAVIRILGGNPGKFTLQGTNTYLLGTGPTRILLDTAQGLPLWRNTLSALLSTESCTVSTALLTHHHHDHVLGVPDLLSLCPSAQVHKHTPTPQQHPITQGQVFTAPGVTLTAIHTPGHTPDHMCFFFAEENALFTGDTVLGHGTTVFEDLAAYMRSLEALLLQLQGVVADGGGGGGVRAYPGHGEVVEDARGKVEEYIRHRKLREAQIVRALGKGGRVGSMQIVEGIYGGVGIELMRAAEGGTVQVLEKLEGEGKVGCEEESDGVVRWFLKEAPEGRL